MILTLLSKVKSGFMVGLLFLVAGLSATVLFLRNEHTQAKQAFKNVKRDLTISETVRESEKILQEALHKTRSQANEAEQTRQERKATDDRPDKFGDPRLHQRSRNSTTEDDS